MLSSRSEIRRSRYLAYSNSGITPDDARVLIVGDRPGPRASNDPLCHGTPFYGDKFSGGYVNRLLDAAHIDENSLMWVNAYSQAGVPTDGRILFCKPWDEVIVLGNNADVWASKRGVTRYTKIEHPQAHRRFNQSKYQYPLIQLLQKYAVAT